MRVTIEAPDLGKLADKFDSERLVKRRIKTLLRKAGNVVRNEMRKQVPRGERQRARRGEGRQKRLYQSIRLFTSKLNQVTVRATAKQAHLVEGGTKPHPIEAKRARALRFGEFYRASVQHPGARAQPFVRKTVQASQSEVDAILREGANEIKREIESR